MARGCARDYSVVGITAQETADHLHGVTTVGEESTLLGALSGVLGLAIELAAPDFAQLLAPVDISFAQGLVDVTTRQATLGQFFAVWGQPFSNTTLADITGLPIVVYTVDDNVVTEVPDDEWNDIELTSKRQIVIQVGTPLTEIPNYTWTGD